MTTARFAAKSPLVQEPKGKVRFWLPWLALAFAVIISIGFYLIDAHWPYRYRNVDPLLQKIFASQVKIDQYHRTYFPNPRFVATGLTLHRNSAPELVRSAPHKASSWRDVGSIFSFYASGCV